MGIKRLIITLLFLTIIITVKGQVYHGFATYYGRQAHGKFTTSGERINMNDFVAAHKSLPFGTRIKVTNKKNNKSIIIRVIDRCSRRKPWRFLDLSYGAAKELNMLYAGRVYITLEVLDSLSLIKNQEILTKQNQIFLNGNMLDSLELSARSSLLKVPDSTSTKFGVVVGTTNNKASSYQSSKIFARKYQCKTLVIPKKYRNKNYFQITVVGFLSFEDADKYRIEITKKIRGAKVVRYS